MTHTCKKDGLRKTWITVEYPNNPPHLKKEEFEIEVVDETSDVLVVACPWCGDEFNLVYGAACANGHIAYTVIAGEDMQ